MHIELNLVETKLCHRATGISILTLFQQPSTAEILAPLIMDLELETILDAMLCSYISVTTCTIWEELHKSGAVRTDDGAILFLPVYPEVGETGENGFIEITG